MKKEYSFDELLHKAASYCSISEHCTSEVQDKLIAWGVDEENRSKIIDKLTEDDFINEQNGIEAKLIEMALKTIDEGEYEEMLAVLLKNKLKTIKWEYEYEKMGKLFNFAQSRGFESNVIDRVIRTLKD